MRQHHCNHCNINDVIVCCAHTICNVIMPVQCLVSSVTKRRICSIFLFYYDKVCERVMSVIEKSTMSTLCLKKVVGLHQTHGNNFCQLLTDFQNVLIPAFHRTCWWKIFYRFCWKFTSLSSSERILKNRLRTDKVIAMSLVYYFFGAHCICVCKWLNNTAVRWNISFIDRILAIWCNVSAARCYASAAYAVMPCLSICLSRSCILSKRINISSLFSPQV